MQVDSDTDDEEDTADKIAERVEHVRAMVEREDMRHKCYAAAMSRWWGVPPSHFARGQRGPNKLPMPERGYEYKTAKENGGVKSMIETCLDALDVLYEQVGDDVLSPAKRMRESEMVCPTAYEHNNMLCLVRPQKRQRVLFC